MRLLVSFAALISVFILNVWHKMFEVYLGVKMESSTIVTLHVFQIFYSIHGSLFMPSLPR